MCVKIKPTQPFEFGSEHGINVTRRRVVVVSLLLLLLTLVGLWTKRNLRERLLAIPSQGGEIFNKRALATPHYLQTDPRWEDETVGGSDERLGRVGCTVCSLAIPLDHYGVKATPKELNDFLKENDGYTTQGWLKWNSVTPFTDNKVSMDFVGRPTFKRIDRALKNEQPVIAKIYINGVISHWVLIVGKEQTEYLIRDPLGDGQSLSRLSEYGSKIYAIRVLKGTTAVDGR